MDTPKPARYMGSFPVNGTDQASRAELVTTQLHHMKESGRAIPVLIVVSLAGVKVCRPNDQSVQMAHALRRISYATCEPARALFGFVAREPRGPANSQFCHSFTTDTAKQAEELNALVGNAFRMAFATQLHPAHPPSHNWKEVTNNHSGDLSTMGIRAPNSIPGLRHHYPHNFSGTHSLKNNNLKGEINESTSPSSSEESNSPTELNSYKRLVDKPPLMKRLALGLSGALLLQATHTDDSTPLVPDTPTSPSHKPVTLNGGYVNEAISDNDIKSAMIDVTKNSLVNDEVIQKSSIPMKHIHIDNVNINNAIPCIDKTNSSNFDVELLKKNNNNKNNNNRILRIPSSSSSSCGGGGSPPLLPARSDSLSSREEAELRLAPWFQAGIPREIALEVLGGQPVGAFMVRESTTKSGCFALSLRVPRDFQPSGIAHYLILHTNKGYKIKGFTKEFTSLTALITHHSVMPELLPCPLSLSRYNPSFAKTDTNRDFEDIDNDPDYNTLADFRKMMADLNV
ncbi:EGFR adapter protein-like [Arctopsyche grandis]|uniref:EGFR adapter protein-like n=1 Tax=Arctopsyche grandis TaxID=121162 RepID=UPI00406D7754